jgi:hypothetical protein
MVIEQDMGTGHTTIHIRGCEIHLTEQETRKLLTLLLHTLDTTA